MPSGHVPSRHLGKCAEQAQALVGHCESGGHYESGGCCASGMQATVEGLLKWRVAKRALLTSRHT